MVLSTYSPANNRYIHLICCIYLGVYVKQYNIRMDPVMVSELNSLGGCRSSHIRQAVTTYLHGDIHGDTNTGYNEELVTVLKDQVLDLKQDKDLLQNRLDFYMLPWYHKLLLPKPKSKSD